jgi:hypothetical protein
VAWLDADTALPSRRIASLAVWIFALVMAYPYLPGSGTEAFKGPFGARRPHGFHRSLGDRRPGGERAHPDVHRTYRPGEYVRVAEHEGTIVELGMFTSRLRTGLGESSRCPTRSCSHR